MFSTSGERPRTNNKDKERKKDNATRRMHH